MFPSVTSIRREAIAMGYGDLVGSVSSVRRTLIAAGLTCRVKQTEPGHSAADVDKRYTMTRKRRFDVPGTHCFVDESKASLDFVSSRTEWVEKHERPKKNSKSQYPVSVMVFGAIALGFRHLVFLPQTVINEDGEKVTYHVNAETYKKRCLMPLCKAAVDGAGRIFVQDNAPPHRPVHVRTYLESKGWEVIDFWPPHSPDLNPIENMWSIIKAEVSRRGPTTREQLLAFIREEWNAIPQVLVDSLVCSFPKRCENVFLKMGEY